MTTAILVAGLIGLAALAYVVVRLPVWRLPALLLALLALPGNVDNLGPQFRLDPNAVANPLAPAVPVTDLLIMLALAVAILERRRVFGVQRWFVGGGLLVAAIMSASAALALTNGVEGGAVVRGMLTAWRIPALLFLGMTHRKEIGDGRRLGFAAILGTVVLVGNGGYTTISGSLERFTATTFGRNGFAVALASVTVLLAGLAYSDWRDIRGRRWSWIAAALAVVALAGLLATGTRMGLAMLIFAGVASIIIGPVRSNAATLRGIGATIVGVGLAVTLALAFSVAGQRTLSLISDTGDTIGEAVTGITNPGDLPSYSAIRSRSFFWRLAVQMAIEHPVTGVGPFQWNHVRYQLDLKSPHIVADAHNSYLQIGAEYGVPALLAYLVLLGGSAWFLTLGVLRRRGRWTWIETGILVAAASIPVADLTNSHLFHVRMGAVEWLLIAVALALVLSVGRDAPATRAVSA
ncbi:MAG: O-antigen ligase family protein [Chloroflexota bacterium]